MNNVTCSVCGRTFRSEDDSIQCDEPRCPMKGGASVLEVLAIQTGVPVQEDHAKVTG